MHEQYEDNCILSFTSEISSLTATSTSVVCILCLTKLRRNTPNNGLQYQRKNNYSVPKREKYPLVLLFLTSGRDSIIRGEALGCGYPTFSVIWPSNEERAKTGHSRVLYFRCLTFSTAIGGTSSFHLTSF